MTIDLLLVFLLHAKDYLCGYDALIRIFEVEVGVKCERSGVFEKMGRYLFFVDFVFHVVSWLVDA